MGHVKNPEELLIRGPLTSCGRSPEKTALCQKVHQGGRFCWARDTRSSNAERLRSREEAFSEILKKGSPTGVVAQLVYLPILSMVLWVDT
jgi:hypothetical protein